MSGRGHSPAMSMLRSVFFTSLPVASIVGALCTYAGVMNVQERSEVPLLLAFMLLFAAGGLAYWHELRQRHVWSAALRMCSEERFETFAQQMRDAAPVVNLEVPGIAQVPYSFAEWRDETTWSDFGMDVKRGLVLASFPFEFVPGDHAEANALEFAKAKVADDAARGGKESDMLHTDVALRLLLRWPDGAEVEALRPTLLHSGPTGAEWLSPCLMLLACGCLCGLILDDILLCLAEPVDWPIRKRFFTSAGNRLGSLSFSCAADGTVQVEGKVSDIRSANQFWISNDEHWELVKDEMAELAPDLLAIRRMRRVGQVLAFVCLVVATSGAMVKLQHSRTGQTPAGFVLAGIIISAGICAVSFLIEHCTSQQRVATSSEKLGRSLPGGATVSTAWTDATCSACSGNGDTSLSELSIEVEQAASTNVRNGQLPVLKSCHTAPLPCIDEPRLVVPFHKAATVGPCVAGP